MRLRLRLVLVFTSFGRGIWVLGRVDVRDRQRANYMDRRTGGDGNRRKGRVEEKNGEGTEVGVRMPKSTLDEL